MINHFIYTNIETTNNNKIFQDFKLITEWLFIPSVILFSYAKASMTALSQSYVV